MEREQLKSVLESLIFVSEEPMTVGSATLILEPDGVTKQEIEEAIEELKQRYNADLSYGLELREIAGGYQFRTKPNMAEFIQRLNIPKPQRLSQAALETMAIIAYRQPVVRSEIEEIRGVDVGGVLKTLLERNLIKVIGKRDEPGNPMIYGTTAQFLELFGLSSLKEMPTLREYEELEKERYGSTGETKEEDSMVQSFVEMMNAVPPSEKWTVEDDRIMNDLESGIKSIRRLEKEIFPKPVEQIVLQNQNGENISANSTAPAATEEPGEPSSPETNSGSDQSF